MKKIEKRQKSSNHLKPEHPMDDKNLTSLNQDLQKKIERLERKINREKIARREAERVMETKSLELYTVNLELSKVNQSLEDTVALRTKELSENLKHVEIINKELMDIAYVVSHDVRGSVRQIGGLVSLIEEEYKTDNLTKSELGDYVSEIKNRTFKMYHLLDGIREYISIGRKFNEVTEVDLQLEMFKVINQINIPKGFQINLINQLPSININKDRFFQIFNHIIKNAVEYSPYPSQGVINIEFQNGDTHFEISISDNGSGIAPRYHDKIFKLFQLLGKNKKGKGIGLPIVKKMVETINGEISVESQEGQGATFRVLFPNTLLVH